MEVPRHETLPVALVHALIARAQGGDQAALARVVETHQRFVFRLATRMHGRLPLEDAVQEGNLGLLRAVARFDPTRGAPFTSYAAIWVRSKITFYVIRVPENACHGPERVQPPLVVSLDGTGATTRLRDQKTLAETIQDPAAKDRAETVVACQEAVERLSGLEKRRRFALRSHFGLDDEGREWSLERIGSRLGVSRERARQLVESALVDARTKRKRKGRNAPCR